MTNVDLPAALGSYPLVEAPGVPQGYRPGDVPPTRSWKRELWIVSPPERTASQEKILRNIIHEADSNAIPVSLIRTEKHQFRQGHVLALRPADARRLYLRLHRALVGVFALGGFRVQRDISERVTQRTSVPLDQFVQYKSFCRLVSRPFQVQLAVHDFKSWSEPGIDSVNFRDPRCLPFMIFEDASGLSLDTAEDRKKFEQRYSIPHKPAHRTDDRRRIWEIGPCHAPSYLLHVKGSNLPLGSHWDVQVKRQEVLVNGWERWVFAAHEHANIHPNAHFHGPNGTKTDGLDERATPTPARTPRHVRQKGAQASAKKMPRH